MNEADGDAADVAEKTTLQDSPALDAWWWSLAALFFPRLGPAWPIRGFSLSLSLFPFSSLFSSLPLSLFLFSLFFHSSLRPFYPRPFLVFSSLLFFSLTLLSL